ncbi:MAG: NAD(P)-dependent alcohol dehydrogenase [Actinomycetota bacterium]
MHTPISTDPSTEPTPADHAAPWRMPAAVARTYGTGEVVELTEIDVPVPGEGEVLVEVKAASLNALDWHFLTGTPYLLRIQNGLRRPKRVVHGADIAGRVVALGTDVDSVAVGDEVIAEANGGGCAPYAVVKTKYLVPKPSSVTFQDAAAVPVAGLTALQGLRTHGDVQPGDRVLINGAAGGVGTFAVQIAKALGAHVTAVCSGRNLEMVRALGADVVVDYETEDVTVGGPRFDVMLDNVGNHSPKQAISMLEPGARFVLVSGPKDGNWLGPIAHMIQASFAFRRVEPSFHQFMADPNHEDLTTLSEWLAVGTIVPQIDRVIGLDGVAAALDELGTGHARAKIVVEPQR